MIFSSYEFVFLFLPIVLICYFLLSKCTSSLPQHIFLIIASIYFYGYFNHTYMLLIAVSISINYILAIGMTKTNGNRLINKAVFITSILFNIALLGFFKYYDFFISTVNSIFSSNLPLLHILLPLGISFFTFQQLSFVISIYKGEETLPDFVKYCLFVTFFPQLIAGPIVLFSEMNPQFNDASRRRFNWNNFSPGVYLFVLGMAKKLLIADTLSVIVDNGYEITDIHFEAAWVISVAYAMQIYFDFSGYNDMAVGLGKMFNFDLASNFNSPYRSTSITDFWRRWHITLGRALTTYIYIPLGGNRRGLPRTCLNLAIVFLISGIWHGANWTFILWGALHGAFIVAERIAGIDKKIYRTPCSRTGHRIVTFLIVNFLWVFFRAESISRAVEIIEHMLNPMDHNAMQIFELAGSHVHISNFDLIYAYIALFAAVIIVLCCPNSQQDYGQRMKSRGATLYIPVLFVLCMICMTRVSPFIYYNF